MNNINICNSYLSVLPCVSFPLGITSTFNYAYNEKQYVEILLHYRWLFVKGDVIIGEWGIFGVEVFLHYSQFFVKSDFIIGGVEYMFGPLSFLLAALSLLSSPFTNACFSNYLYRIYEC